MANLTIRDIPDQVLATLRERAAANRRSLNSEILTVLEQAVSGEEAGFDPVYQRIRERRAEWRAQGISAPPGETLRRWIEDGRERVDEDVMEAFRERAKDRGVSAEQAVRELIEQAAREALRARDWHEDVTAFRERLREKYGNLPSSAELIREDRDAR